MAETGLIRTQIIGELSKSAHGKLETYQQVIAAAAKEDPLFLAHLIAWNREKGQVRDAKVALPIISLASPDFPDELVENSLAHFALLDVKMKEQGLRYFRTLKAPARRDRAVKRALRAYLTTLEANFPKWERVAVQHRRRLKGLYVAAHLKPAPTQRGILFFNDEVGKREEYPRGSIFEAIANLGKMSPSEAAGTILERRIPSLIAVGALGSNGGALLRERDVVMALTERMSETELVTRTKSLAKKGVKTDPVLRAAFSEAAAKVAKSTKNVLKTTRAAEALEEAGELELAATMRAVQEKQIAKMVGIEGDWLVLGDKSGSMQRCIEMARQVASVLTKLVRGRINLIFFDTLPMGIDATGMTYEQILDKTKFVRAAGGTSIGCGLKFAIDKKLPFDGIAIVSDAQENQAPLFAPILAGFCKTAGRDIPVYLYRMQSYARRAYSSDLLTSHQGDRDLKDTMAAVGKDLQEFDLSHNQVDYYSLPDLAQSMRTNRYSLIDEILDSRLLRLEDVLGAKAASA